jgi:rhodanese-related sulfurtransferase
MEIAADTSSYHAVLPSFSSSRDAIKRISAETLVRLMDGEFNIIDGYEIIDCRFGYEFEGGHIRGALNINTHADLNAKFYPNGTETQSMATSQRIVIFHCEFSSHRGPRM